MVCDDGGPWATSFTNEALPNNYKAYPTTVLQRSKVIFVRYTTLRHNGLWEGIHIIYFRYNVKEFVLLMFKIMSHVDSHFRCGVDIVYFISYYTTVIASAFFFYFKQHFSTSEVIPQQTRKHLLYILNKSSIILPELWFMQQEPPRTEWLVTWVSEPVHWLDRKAHICNKSFYA